MDKIAKTLKNISNKVYIVEKCSDRCEFRKRNHALHI